MIIAYIGNFRPQHSTENFVAMSLEDMGHFVIRLQEDELTDTLPNVDMLLWTRTWAGHVTDDTLKIFKDRHIPTVSLHYDLYVGISREDSIAGDPFWHTDYVFTTDGDPKSLAFFKKNGINHYYLPAGVYKKSIHRGKFNPKYACDVAFVGTAWNYHPEWPYRIELVDWLQKTYGLRFRHYGQKGRPGIRGEELNDLFASAKVVIGDALCKNFTHENYWSDRLYETTGRGGFLIHPYIKGIETQFEHPQEIITYPFGDFVRLKGMIDFYVKEDRIREIITERAMKRDRKEHTIQKRMEKVLEVVNGR